MKFSVGKKIEMTQIWKNEVVVPVTKIKLDPGTVVQVKTKDKDGYNAIVVGFGTRKEKNINKPQRGQMQGLGNFKLLKEFRYDQKNDQAEFDNINRGDRVEITTFEAGDKIDVKGVSKGKGFQGGVKRHGFHGQDTTHGTKDQVRMPGSVGAGEPQHVFKGLRMAGRMGNENVTVKNLEVIDINLEENVILVKGAVPGARNSVITVLGKGALKFTKKEDIKEAAKEEVKAEPKEEPKAEAPVEEKKEPVATEAVEVKEAKPEEKAEAQEEKKEPVVTEATEVKDEKAEAKAEEEPKEAAVAKKPAEKFQDDYIAKFAHLPKDKREKFSTPEITAAIAKLEETYKADLIPAITKVMVGDLKTEDLEKYLIDEIKLEAPKAAELAKEIKEQIFK